MWGRERGAEREGGREGGSLYITLVEPSEDSL